MGNSTHTASIHILDDDSLLYLFYLYRPFLSGEDEDYTRIMGGNWQWAGERWWYLLPTRARLPNMEKPHTWVCILPGTFPHIC